MSALIASRLPGDHAGGLSFLILDGQCAGRTGPLTFAGPAGTAVRLRQARSPGRSRQPRQRPHPSRRIMIRPAVVDM
jgi:hypothetical protein